jgi:putative redox protein
MATDSAHRGVSIDRIAAGQFTARNDRGGQIAIGTGGDADFTPSGCCSRRSAGVSPWTWTS